jgi:DDE superfamily endonuclease
VMLLWTEMVLKPYVETRPEGVIPVVFLDSLAAYKTRAVRKAIHDLGCRIEYIPPGCTGSCQPIDVGWNKPFQDHMRSFYKPWQRRQIKKKKNKAPSRRRVAKWTLRAWAKIRTNIVFNSWRHGECAIIKDGQRME